MNDVRKLARVAHALDEQGLHAQADVLTQVMRRLQDRVLRTAQVLIGDPFSSGQQGLTFSGVTQGVPGSDMLTKNLASGAFGAQAGFNQVPGGTYNQAGGPENPLDQRSNWEFNLRGMNTQQIAALKAQEMARNAPQMITRLIPYLRQVKDFYDKKPGMSAHEKNDMVANIIRQAAGMNMDQGVLLQALQQGWPDMPADIRQQLERQARLMQQINQLSQPYTGAVPSSMSPLTAPSMPQFGTAG